MKAVFGLNKSQWPTYQLQQTVGVHQTSVLSPLLYAIVVDAITENARRMVNKLLHADDLVLTSETMDDLKERFWN